MKIIFDIKIEIKIFEYEICQISINSENFDFGTNSGSTGGTYFIKIIFHIKIKIRMYEISNVPNFNKSLAFLIWGLIRA